MKFQDEDFKCQRKISRYKQTNDINNTSWLICVTSWRGNLHMQGSHSDCKTWKIGKAFSSQGILNRLEKSGKITQNTGELREFEINII